MAKTIVICSDGTGQKADSDNVSNVIRLCSLLDLEDRNKQVCCYDAGLGTITTQGGLDKLKELAPLVDTFEDKDSWLKELRRRIVKVPLGKAGGFFLEENVEQLYRYLAQHYAGGDHIYLFGFSRGAFTVRVLAGLLDRCGLLPSDKLHFFSEAYHHYEKRRTETEDTKFRDDNHAIRCGIRFLGIWDTVKAYGYFRPLGLPNTRHNMSIDTVRHALSLDERRSTFLPTTWGWGESDAKEGCQEPTPEQRKKDVREVWFAGDHSDVGGGWEEPESGLAKLSLKWMIGEAWDAARKTLSEEGGPPLLINDSQYQEMFRDLPLPPRDPLYKRHDRLADWKKNPGSTIGFRISHKIPRPQLKNCPHPHLEPWLLPTGQRNIADTGRNNKILIHESVEKIYGKSKQELCGYWKETNRLSANIDVNDIDIVKTTLVPPKGKRD